jgi:23S rRNA (uridine2552-2'-O)-methyltransferase
VSEKGSGGSRPGGRVAGRQGGDGERAAGVGRERVRKSNKFTPSQRAWLERQLNDPYVQRAKREGYRSRAAYKLIELDDKFHFLKPNGRVLDLGAAPGGWSQVSAQRVGRATGRGMVVGIDLLPMDPIPGVELLELDFTADNAPQRLVALLGGRADVVLSDMAANATGHKRTDHLRIMGLVEMAVEFAREVLAPGGAFVAKVLQGGTEAQLLADLKRDFATVRHVKPAASRSDSSELYVLAMGYRGPADAGEPTEKVG